MNYLEWYRIGLVIPCLALYQSIEEINGNELTNEEKENPDKKVSKLSEGLAKTVIPLMRFGKKLGKKDKELID
ncbi:MAG: hypothetical protein L0H53_03975 [Candidatus Nitrosocosmicus sp.]|nr:hypothetical protein [Candidatus Nitrosocosmicus sp.]MDN5867800.1 hypothetical protein [Candidatus Nitrosocosmicus sp.]